jgi:hypothetical protein
MAFSKYGLHITKTFTVSIKYKDGNNIKMYDLPNEYNTLQAARKAALQEKHQDFNYIIYTKSGVQKERGIVKDKEIIQRFA